LQEPQEQTEPVPQGVNQNTTHTAMIPECIIYQNSVLLSTRSKETGGSQPWVLISPAAVNRLLNFYISPARTRSRPIRTDS